MKKKQTKKTFDYMKKQDNHTRVCSKSKGVSNTASGIRANSDNEPSLALDSATKFTANFILHTRCTVTQIIYRKTNKSKARDSNLINETPVKADNNFVLTIAKQRQI